MWSYRFASPLLALFLLSSSLLSVHANDECKDAVVISSLPFETTGDVTQATVDFGTPSDTFRNLTCGIGTDAIGVWYRIQTEVGQRKLVKATVTDAVGTSTIFQTALFQGSNGCDDLECLRDRQYERVNERTQPTLTWFAQEDTSYYLLVVGINAEELGNFTLEVEELSLSHPSNDQCETTAKALELAEVVTGDSTGAWPHGLENNDCSLHAFSRGLFYAVEGTGESMGVTLTTDIAEGRLEVAILKNSSDCSQCVTVSDFLTAEDMPHTTVFDTELNQTYVVVVSGEGFSDSGVFQVELVEQTIESTADRSSISAGIAYLMVLGMWIM